MTNTLLTRHDPAEAQIFHANGTWGDETHYRLLAKNAAARPDAFALRDGARRLTWSELVHWVDVMSVDLAAQGLRANDRVSLWASNRIESVVMYLACSRNGYACNPSLHRTYTVDEISGLLDRLSTKAILVEEGWGADVSRHDPFEALGSLPAMRKVYRVPATRETGPEFPITKSADIELPASNENPDKVCYLAFTSGTTGTPKCVMHSDNTLLANARDMVRHWKHDETSRLLSLSPLSHHIAWVGIAQWLLFGGEFVTDDPPAGVSKLDWILETEPTYIMGVPTHAMDTLAEMRKRGLEKMGTVKVFYMAGAPIPPATAQSFVEMGVTPQNVYGMTENSSHHYTWPDDPQVTICESCGRGGKAYRLKIFDPENPDIEMPQGEVGHIAGKGACLMLGYFDNQKATEESFNKDGWFLSGDLGLIDADGCLRFVGRLKDIIIRGGKNIHPKKIEDLAIKHPNVEKAAAFPVPDGRLGERVCLAVLSTGSEPEGQDVLGHLFGHGLSIYDMPEYYMVMTEFPLTPSGKILKRELTEWAKDGRLKPDPIRFAKPKEA
jgi:acyl-CoA synthetase